MDANNLTNVEIEAAYQKLSNDEKNRIDILAKKLESAIKKLHKANHPIQFGRKQSLELLAKTGICLWKKQTIKS